MESQFNFFKIPFSKQKQGEKERVKDQIDENLHVVGIIDASGSMCSWWGWIAEFYNASIPRNSLYTLTFDHRVFECKNNTLKKRIMDHGGGRTAIPEVFERFEQHLETVPEHKNITVLFISDGMDSSPSNLQTRMEKLKGNSKNRNINFICLGIKNNFPTFLSMRLRQLYHRGDEAIPALYLIEYVSEKAFFNKFEGIKKYFFSSGNVEIEPPVQYYPWDESLTDSAYEGSWVIVQSDSIKVNGTEYKIANQQNLNVEQVVEIFRGWVQQLQLVSLNNMQEAIDFAKIAIVQMRTKIDELNKALGLNVLMKLNEQNNQIGDAFCLRSKKNYIIRHGSKLQWFLDEIEQLSQGKSPKYENEFEAAKRMNIGTITGKYQQKALALKFITVGVFEKYIADFVEVYKKTKLQKLGDQPVSSIKQILMQPDFLEGLSYIRNQFDFVEMFEVTGHGIKLKRCDATAENLNECEPRLLTKSDLDLPTLIQKDYRVEFKGLKNIQFTASDLTGQKEEEFQGDVNALVPLFNFEQDQDLIPLMNTKLMQFLMTYLITNNADYSSEDGYLLLVGNLLQLAMNNFSSANEDIQREFLKKCSESLKVFYGDNQNFKNRCKMLAENPEMYVQANLEDNLQKTMVYLFFVLSEKDEFKLNQEKAEKILQFVYLIFFRRLLGANDSNINNILRPEFTANQRKEVESHIKKKLKEYFSISQFRKDFAAQFEHILKETRSDVILHKRLLYGNEQNQISLEVLENLGRLILNKQQKYSDYSVYIKHVNDNVHFYEVPVTVGIQDVNAFIYDRITQENIKFFPGFSVLFKECEEMYSQLFQENHWGIKPMQKEEIFEICKKKGIDTNKLEFSVSGLLKNACCAQKCEFFLQPSNDLDKHLAGWRGKVPRGFHRFVSVRLEEDPKKLIKQAKLKWGKKFPTDYGIDEKYVLKYIQETQEQYRKNKGLAVGEDKKKVENPENNNNNQEEEEEKKGENDGKFTNINDYIKQNWLRVVEEQRVNPFQNKEFLEKKKEDEQKNSWECGSCTFENPKNNKECQICGWDPKKPDEWICPKCTFKNSPRSYRCDMCQEGVRPEQQKKKEVEKKKVEQQKPDNKFEAEQNKIPQEIRDKWNTEQKYLKTILVEDDRQLDFEVFRKDGDNNKEVIGVNGLKFVAGVDISFSQDVENLACSYLTVLSYPDMKIVYEDHEFVKLTMPYVSGFLAFREAAHLVNLFDRLMRKAPELKPQVIMVDGNGVLHQNGCGLASHLGVLMNIPTIGVGKTTFYVDGLTKQFISDGFQNSVKTKGEYFPMKGQTGRIWGAALKSEENVKNPIYVSVGHKISISTATYLVQSCCKFRIPEPVRQADLISREKIRKMTKEEQENASEGNKLIFLSDLYAEEFPSDDSDDGEVDNNNRRGNQRNKKQYYKKNKYKNNRKK